MFLFMHEAIKVKLSSQDRRMSKKVFKLCLMFSTKKHIHTVQRNIKINTQIMLRAFFG